MAKLLKTISVVLCIGSLALLVFWEGFGREMLYYKEVVVTTHDINANEVISEEDLTTIKVLPETRLYQSYTSENIDEIVGQTTMQFIPQNAQIVSEYLER